MRQEVKHTEDKTEIDRTIENLRKKGKIKEAEYLSKHKNNIEHSWQPLHIWVIIWRRISNYFSPDKNKTKKK